MFLRGTEPKLGLIQFPTERDHILIAAAREFTICFGDALTERRQFVVRICELPIGRRERRLDHGFVGCNASQCGRCTLKVALQNTYLAAQCVVHIGLRCTWRA